MSKNTKCPVCEKGTIMFKDNLSCECSRCKFQCHHGQIERIAAAMELARAAVWASECEDQRDYLEETRDENRERYRSIINIETDANNAAWDALHRCEEVFNA